MTAFAEEMTESYLKTTVFKKLLALPWYAWVTLGLLIALCLALIISRRRGRWTSRALSSASMCIAIGFVLSLIRLYRMPQGGSVTPASMLPLVMFVMAFGAGKGLACGCAYGLLQLLEGATIVHPIQFLTDYPFAYGAVALAAIALLIPEKSPFRLPAAVFLAFLGRYIMAVFSGTVFFAEYAGDQNALVYSLLYNLSYLGPDMLVCMAVAFIPGLEKLAKSLSKE